MAGAFSGGTFLSSSSTLGGATDIKLLSSCTGFTKIKHVKLEMLNGTRRAWITQNPLHYAGLIHSQRSVDPVIVRCGPSTARVSNLEGGSREEKSDSIRGHTFPNSLQVESLITDICDTTSIAEFELKLGGFRLYVARDLNGKNNPPIPPSLPPVITNAAPEDVGSNGSVVPPTLAITKSKPFIGGIQRLLDTATDEGLAILQSPKVGYFRRSKTIKGKRAPPPCKEKQIVKEGQVLCYVEQLGGEVPIESDVSGEIIKILRQDGEPVGYGDPLIAILPSFPGIKKLQ